jgi:hypothetical protein
LVYCTRFQLSQNCDGQLGFDNNHVASPFAPSRFQPRGQSCLDDSMFYLKTDGRTS